MLFDANGEESEDDADAYSMFEWRTVEGDALTFTVPDGTDAVELLAGPVEMVPGVGSPEDLEQPAFTGAARLLANGCECAVDHLHPGDELTVVIPWRVSGAISLPAGRLRQMIHAHFYKRDTSPAMGGVASQQ
jgi:hypothetical protein